MIGKKENKEERAFFCPRCKSRQVRMVFNLRNIFGMFPRWKCDDCGYESMTFPLLVTGCIKSKNKKKIR